MTHTPPLGGYIIENRPMTWQQALIVAITVCFSAVDGFDVLAIAVSS